MGFRSGLRALRTAAGAGFVAFSAFFAAGLCGFAAGLPFFGAFAAMTM